MSTRTLGRSPVRWGLPRGVLALLLLVLVSSPPGARAAGTGGIEVTPVPSMRGGKAITTFTVTLPASGTKSVPYTLRNLDSVPRSARVFAAQVNRSDGNFTLGAAGSSPYVSSEDRTMTLSPGQVLQEQFTVRAGKRLTGKAYAAMVVEVRRGAVVQNAATLITLSPASSSPLSQVPTLLVVVAVLLLLVGAAAVLRAVRSRS